MESEDSVDTFGSPMETHELLLVQQEKKPRVLTSPRAANPLKHTERTLLQLAKLMAKQPNGIPLKDRRYRWRLVKSCFQASEAVEWLMNMKYTKEEAVYTCKELAIKQHISHVADKKREFVEGASLYQFSDEIKQMIQKQIEEVEKEEQAARQSKPRPLQDDDNEGETAPMEIPPAFLQSTRRPSSTILTASLSPTAEASHNTLTEQSLMIVPDFATPPSSSPSSPSVTASNELTTHIALAQSSSNSSLSDLKSPRGLFSIFSKKRLDSQEAQESGNPSTTNNSNTVPITTSLSAGTLRPSSAILTTPPMATTNPALTNPRNSNFETMSTTLLNMFGHKTVQDLTFPISPDAKHIATQESLKKILQRRAKSKEKAKKKASKPESEKNVKLVVLGVGECGKSTLLRQWRMFIRNDFTEDWQRIGFIPIVNEYVILIMESLLSVVEESQLQLSQNAGRWITQFWESELSEGVISPQQTEALQQLWKDQSIQSAYETITNENIFCLDHSTKYFLDAIDRITRDDYVPSFEDMLRVRTSPTCISEIDFNINNESWRMVDTGGSYLSQKSWIHCFNDVSCLIYVVDTSCVFEISAINEELEDRKTYFLMEDNPMYDSLRAFSELCGLRWFAKTPIILVFNKINILQERMMKGGVDAIKHFFTDYRGADDWRAALSFIQQQFVVQNQSSRPLYCFYVNAITPDEAKIKQTFESIQQAVLSHLSQEEG